MTSDVAAAGVEPGASHPGHARYLIVGLAFFALYQVSLLGAVHPGDSFWRFGADSMEELFQRRSTTLAGVKHPLFALITPPLYQLGRLLYSWAPEDLAARLALIFPVALLGALNTALAIWVLEQNDRDRTTANLLGLLYGLCATSWVFSSYPDTYALTALCTTFFLGVLIVHLRRGTSMLPVAAANALACYASPQQIFLAVIPIFSRLRSERLSKRSLREAAQYGIVLVVLFVLPYLIFLEISGEGWRLAPGYVNAYSDVNRLVDVAWYPVVVLNFLVFSTVGPVVHPSLYRDPTTGFASEVDPYWYVLAGLYLILVVRGLRLLKESSSVLKPTADGLVAFLASYSLFFLVFNPMESFIYSFPALLPWFLLLQSGFAARDPGRWRAYLALLLVAVALNNLGVIAFLNHLS